MGVGRFAYLEGDHGAKNVLDLGCEPGSQAAESLRFQMNGEVRQE